jgi:lysophospholipase L1-like esterase
LLCLGDGLTAGVGVPAAKSYPGQMQALLDARFGARRCQAINGGRPTANSSETLLLLDQALKWGLRPTFVLLTVGADNLWNWRLATPMLNGRDSLDRVRRAVRGLRVLHFLAAVRSYGLLGAKKLYFPNDPNVNPLVAKLALANPDWLKSWLVADVQAANRLCAEKKTQLVLIGSPFPSPEMRSALQELRSEPGLIVIDAGNFGLPYDNDVHELLQDDLRPSAAGYAAIAHVVAASLDTLIDVKLSGQAPAVAAEEPAAKSPQ